MDLMQQDLINKIYLPGPKIVNPSAGFTYNFSASGITSLFR